MHPRKNLEVGTIFILITSPVRGRTRLFVWWIHNLEDMILTKFQRATCT